MPVRILCVGDVVGRPGRQALSEHLPKLKKQYSLDCVLVNAENVAGGSGLTPPLYEKLKRYGASVITLGDHAYRRREVYEILQRHTDVLRPANFPPDAVGREHVIWETASGIRMGVVVLLGRIFMKPLVDCPFRTADRVLSTLPHDVKVVLVEMHAEATSEKVAIGWHLDGRASLVFGTHTHVQTSDERVLPGGTAYISDLGMTGPRDSVLGRRKDNVVKSLMTGMPHSYDVAMGDPWLHGAVVTVDEASGRALGIERVALPCTTTGEADIDDPSDHTHRKR